MRPERRAALKRDTCTRRQLSRAAAEISLARCEPLRYSLSEKGGGCHVHLTSGIVTISFEAGSSRGLRAESRPTLAFFQLGRGSPGLGGGWALGRRPLADKLPHLGEIRGLLALENPAPPVFCQLPISPFRRRVFVLDDGYMPMLGNMLTRGLISPCGPLGGWLG